jgi:hypothetical protein
MDEKYMRTQSFPLSLMCGMALIYVKCIQIVDNCRRGMFERDEYSRKEKEKGVCIGHDPPLPWHLLTSLRASH